MRAEPFAEPPAPDPIKQRYRDEVVAAFGHLTLHGLPETRHHVGSLPLEDVFVRLSLRLRDSVRPDDELRAAFGEADPASVPPDGNERDATKQAELMRFEARRREREATERAAPVSIAEALSRTPHLAVVGPPGSGKSTLTRWLALGFARERQADPDRLGPAFAHPRLPVLIELRQFVRWIKDPERFPGAEGLALRLADYVADDARFHGAVRDPLLAALERGICLLVFDGLDEVADASLRGRIVEAIKALARSDGAGGNLILVTGRPAGFQGVDLGLGFHKANVEPFTPDDVRLFLKHWYRTAYGPTREGEAEELARQIEA